MVAVFEWLKQVFFGQPVYCQHKWSLPKQLVVGDKVFIGRRCKLCGKVE